MNYFVKHIWSRLVFTSGIVIALDQITKYIIKINIALHDNIAVIPNFFSLTHILNPGGAFGFFASSPPLIRKFVFLFLSTLAAVLILWFYKKHAGSFFFLSIGLAMIFGGAVGNLIDRFLYGRVIDFLDFYIGRLHWPAFNIADSAISTGMGIMLYYIIFKKIT